MARATTAGCRRRALRLRAGVPPMFRTTRSDCAASCCESLRVAIWSVWPKSVFFTRSVLRAPLAGCPASRRGACARVCESRFVGLYSGDPGVARSCRRGVFSALPVSSSSGCASPPPPRCLVCGSRRLPRVLGALVVAAAFGGVTTGWRPFRGRVLDSVPRPSSSAFRSRAVSAVGRPLGTNRRVGVLFELLDLIVIASGACSGSSALGLACVVPGPGPCGAPCCCHPLPVQTLSAVARLSMFSVRMLVLCAFSSDSLLDPRPSGCAVPDSGPRVGGRCARHVG